MCLNGVSELTGIGLCGIRRVGLFVSGFIGVGWNDVYFLEEAQCRISVGYNIFDNKNKFDLVA